MLYVDKLLETATVIPFSDYFKYNLYIWNCNVSLNFYGGSDAKEHLLFERKGMHWIGVCNKKEKPKALTSCLLNQCNLHRIIEIVTYWLQCLSTSEED